MPEDFLTVDVTVSRRSIPAPPVSIDTAPVILPDVPSLDIKDVFKPPQVFILPSVDLPPDTFEVDVPTRAFSSIPLPDTESFEVPEVLLPILNVATQARNILDRFLAVIDPERTRLIGGSVFQRLVRGLELPEALVPDVDIEQEIRETTGLFQNLPNIIVDGVDIPQPDFGGRDFPNVSVPTGAGLEGSVEVPDPTGIDVDVDLDTTGLRSFALEPVPDGILSDPKAFAFTAARAYFEAQLGLGITTALRSTVEATLQVVLTEDTRERLRERNEG